MKHKMNAKYSQPIILSDLDLKNNDFSDTWLRGFFFNPVVENLAVVNDQNKIVATNLYLNFAEIELPYSASKDFYKKIHLAIKKYIVEDWRGFGNVKPIYGFHSIKRDDKDVKRFLFVFLSPNKPNKVFDFGLVYSKERLISNILDLLLKAHILEKSNNVNPIAFDVVTGKIFLEPQIPKKNNVDDSVVDAGAKKKKYKSVSVFSFNLNFNENFLLKFGISLERYLLEENKGDLDLYEDFCSINNYKYSKKLDAREHSRAFFSFKNYENLKYSKFATQVNLYKNILEMLNKHKISYEKTLFKPEYIYCDFPKIDVDIKNINVYVKKEELDKYDAYLKGLKVEQSFEYFVSYFEEKFNVKFNIHLDPTFEVVFKTKSEHNLFLMFGEEYEENYVSYVDELGNKKEWNNPLLPFMEKELYKLNEIDFINALKGFDLYSQVKIYNLYANKNGGIPFVSQGLFLNDLVLRVVKTDNKKSKNKKDNSSVVEEDSVPDYDSSFQILAKKLINELNTKYSLYVKKEFNFKSSFNDIENVTSFNKVKILNTYPKKGFKVYSYVDLVGSGSLNGVFKVDSWGLLFEEDVKALNFEFDVNKEFNISDSLIIIDDEYLVKVKDNNLMPIMIMQESKFNVPGKDPILLMQYFIARDSSEFEKPSKSNLIDKNSCFPYNVPAVSSMVDVKQKTMIGNHSAMLDFSDNDLKVFMTLSTHGVKPSIPKNNRLESIQLFKLKDFCFEKQNWLKNEQIMNFYLSSIPFDYMISNAITKKSLLNKLADIVLLN